MKPATIENAQLNGVELLKIMFASREGDRREGILMRQGKGWFQVPGMGHEAIAAIAFHLRPDDYLFPTYRDRALMVARGMTTREIALDFYARHGSSSDGRNMPAHYSSARLNVFSVATPTGAQCLPAAGAAWAFKSDGKDSVAICTIGDAASRQGEFYEAICLAVQDKLPVVFIIEDNQYGISTPTARMLPTRLGIFSDDLIMKINGRDAAEVFAKGGEAIAKARRGDGPTVIWAEIDRLGSHTSADDHRVYRPLDEIDEMMKRDPILLLSEKLIANGELTETDWQAIQDEIAAEIDVVYQETERVPFAPISEVMDHLYGPQVSYRPVPFQPEEPTGTMVQAVNQVLDAGLATFPKTIMYGEDIEDPKGGVFGFTKGLTQKYPGRVTNSPLAEATIVGAAVGLATAGYKPVFEIQFIDFITPGFHQMVSQVGTLRWRSKGEWKCPMVIYSPYGAYLPAGGMWHSQSNDGWWAHIPGMRTAIPSTPEDVVGLFWSAFQDEDPSLILIPKHIFRIKMPQSKYEAIPFGKAAVRREGSDVTIVSWGNCLELAEAAANQAQEEGVSVEIIDLRTIQPWDEETVEKSLAKTGRLVVVHEDQRTCGLGATVVTEMVSHAHRFNSLLAPPQLVARKDVYIPFCPDLEYAVLPDLKQVLQAVYNTME